MKRLIALLFAALFASASSSQVIWQETETFDQAGGWANDPQHIDIMGSPYLLATGVGTPVKDAVTRVKVEKPGTYRLWVRCRDWYPSHSPGRFRVIVNGTTAKPTFGKAADDEWRWVDGGTFDLPAGEVELRLHDETGWWSRCDAVVLAQGDFKPADEPKALAAQRQAHGGVSDEIKNMKDDYDVVVVGGGSSGLGAAIGAARNGARVAFIQDRPVLGGNGSDEIQVPPMGMIGNAPDKINVTGIAEEIYPIQGWFNFASSERIEKIVRAEKNIDLHLNTRGVGVEMINDKMIGAVIAINVHTGERMRFRAPLFIDTTGHGWIGSYAGAEYRMGTEGRSEFNESMAPIEATPHTMGNSLYKAVYEDAGKPVPFERPDWAYKWEKPSDFKQVLPRIKKPIRPMEFDKATRGPGRPIPGAKDLRMGGAYTWYIEIGGMDNTIKDAERIRDELFRIHIGLWAYAKNHDKRVMDHAKTYRMVWLNYVPGVRESRRLMGDYIMTQNDFDNIVEHEDNVAFTDWGIDDHHPHGYFTQGIDVLHVYHGRRVSMPYRSLYSKNIDNLFMAGRCMSVSHLALGGVRVQRPMCATGQVVGTAAAIAKRHETLPRGIYKNHLAELQQTLLRDGCYIVNIKNQDQKDLALRARTRHGAVINGWNRESKGLPDGADWRGPIDLTLEKPATIQEIHLTVNQTHYSAKFVVEVATEKGWKTIAEVKADKENNHRRFVFTFDPVRTNTVRARLLESDRALRICEIRIYE